MTATSIRLRRHKGYVNEENSEARNARNFAESIPNDQVEPEAEDLVVDETEAERLEREALEAEARETAEAEARAAQAEADADADAERLQAEADHADSVLERPNRNQSKETWTTYVEALHTEPEGYSKDLTRDQIADLVLGPKA